MLNSPNNVRGSYLLVMRFPAAVNVTVGSLGRQDFRAGYYVYVGSAMRGLKPRLRRHVNKKKTPHWHIDYITNSVSISTVVIFESEQRLECRIADLLKQQLASIPKFGCGDCICPSHLFFTEDKIMMEENIERIRGTVKVTSYILNRRAISQNLFTGFPGNEFT